MCVLGGHLRGNSGPCHLLYLMSFLDQAHFTQTGLRCTIQKLVEESKIVVIVSLRVFAIYVAILGKRDPCYVVRVLHRVTL